MMTSAADLPYFSILPTGIPRPSSDGDGVVGVDGDKDLRAVPGERLVYGVVDDLPYEVVKTPGPVEPMYIPGRRLTASSPSRTWIELAS